MSSYDLLLSGNHPVDIEFGEPFHTVLNILAVILKTNRQTKKPPWLLCFGCFSILHTH